MHRRAKRDKRDQDRPSAPALLASTPGQLAHLQTKDLKNKNKKESTSKTTNRREANAAGVELAMQQRISELEIKVFELQQQKGGKLTQPQFAYLMRTGTVYVSEYVNMYS